MLGTTLNLPSLRAAPIRLDISQLAELTLWPIESTFCDNLQRLIVLAAAAVPWPSTTDVPSSTSSALYTTNIRLFEAFMGFNHHRGIAVKGWRLN